MRNRLKIHLFLASLMLSVVSAAATFAPRFEITASTTNFYPSESTTLTLHLYLPPLPAPFDAVSPLDDSRAPHLQAEFLALDWSSPVAARPKLKPQTLSASDLPHLLFSGDTAERPREGNDRFFVNDYQNESDPFSLFAASRPLFRFTTQREEIDGVNVWHFTAPLSPWQGKTTGTLAVPAATFQIPYAVNVRTARDLFGRPVHERVMRTVRLRATPPTLAVVEPPQTGRPATYRGTVASNATLTAKLNTNLCTAGDPLVLTVTVSGPDDLSLVPPPSFAAVLDGTNFRIDEASLRTETLADARRFTWRVRTLKAGTVEFPALPFTYFSLATRSYVTVSSDPIPIQVKAGVQAALGDLDELTDDDTFPLPDGLDLDVGGAATRPLLPHLHTALTLFILPPILFLLIRLAPPVRRRVAARNATHRKATAYARLKRALRGRDAARKAAAVRTFFAVRYDVNGATVTAADAERLMANDYPPDDIAPVVSALRDLDRAQYAARATTGTGLTVLLLALLPVAVFGRTTPDTPDTDFTYRRALSLATQAHDATQFKNAVKAYAACLEQGADTPALFANMGACAVFANDPRTARLAFACAERRTGETPSTRRGLQAAHARLKNDPRADLPLTRIFLRPHYSLPLDVRLLVAAVCWAFLWLVALLPPGGARRFLTGLGLLLFLSAALSTTVSLVEDSAAKGALIHVAR